MNNQLLNTLYNTHKETQLFHRYIHLEHIKPLLDKLPKMYTVTSIGESVLGKPIYAVTFGSGEKRVLLWSQMHGNESTTTKALFDMFNTLTESNVFAFILSACTITVIPILNPDGAEAYTRLNANQIDLNRDSKTLTQPESKVLRDCFNSFKPHYCFNLHGQRTIFSAGKTNNIATVSFLSPAQDESRSVTPSRQIGMEIIVKLNENLQSQIPNQVGIYDDSFNINCVGDMFQSLNVPTILFEAGHYTNDYEREITRFYIYQSLLVGLNYIATTNITGANYKAYFDIPENDKLFYDIIIRNANIGSNEAPIIKDIGIMYKETLINKKVEFLPIIEKISDLSNFYGHKEYNANNHKVLDANSVLIQEGNSNDFVIINDIKYSLKLTQY
ncbi:M14 family zinc carboxypeptidase [Corallibacter sp.]|uniref:M14 family zinc carboxypeptidase n=1 Tax=Corallibacter sp. TaxID=2038084 RepID=UPI003AB21137